MRYGVPHDKVNGTELERGENRDGNGDRNGDGNGEGRPVGVEQGRERRKVKWELAERAEGARVKKESVG